MHGAGMTLTVHHLENSRSQRLLWLLEELGLDYVLQRYERDTKTMLAPKALREIHPLGKSPILEHDGVVLAETGAIVEYVLDTFGEGRLRPERGTDAFHRYRFFLHYAEGSVMTPLVVKLITSNLGGKRVPALVRPIARSIGAKIDAAYTNDQLKTHLGFLDAELEGREWFAGELSGADIMLSFPCEAAQERVGASYKRIRAFVGRVHARPAYQRALERGGPYAYA